MKRFLIFVLVGPLLVAATFYLLLLPLASLLERTWVTMKIEPENYFYIIPPLMFAGAVMCLFDWIVRMIELPQRPLILGFAGWCLAWASVRGYLALPDLPGWPIAVGFVGAIPAYACCWLSTRTAKVEQAAAKAGH